MVKKALILTLIMGLMTVVYGYAGTDSGSVVGATSCSFAEWLNTESQNKQIDEQAEKIAIREQWERGLGIDLFSPYFKAKELESMVSEKASVRVFKIKGKPEVREDSAKFIFRLKF